MEINMEIRITKISSIVSVLLFSGALNAADIEESSFNYEAMRSNDSADVSSLSYSASNFNVDPSQCNAILEYAAKDVNTSINRKDRELYIYKQACDYRYEHASGSRKSSIGINVFSYFGLSASGNSSHNTTVINQWCEENQLEYSGMDFDFSHQEAVNETSIRAFESCIALTNKNFEVSPTLEDNQSRFRLRNLTHAPVTLQGVSVVTTDSSDHANTPSNELNVKCTVDTDEEINIRADSRTRIIVNPNNSISVTCKRENVNIYRDGDSFSVFPAYSIIMGTTLGDFGMSFGEVSVTKLTDVRANAIEARLNKLPENRKWYRFSAVHNKELINNYSYEIIVSAHGGNGGSGSRSNRCNLNIYVDGLMTSHQNNANSKYSKGCNVSATIPSGATWKIVSLPYDAGVGRFSTQILH